MADARGSLLAAAAAVALLVGVGSVVATRSPAVSAAPAVEPLTLAHDQPREI